MNLVGYFTVFYWRARVICTLATSGLRNFTITLALGSEIVSVSKIWKPISNISVVEAFRVVTARKYR